MLKSKKFKESDAETDERIIDFLEYLESLGELTDDEGFALNGFCCGFFSEIRNSKIKNILEPTREYIKWLNKIADGNELEALNGLIDENVL